MEALISMCIPKEAALIRGWCLFETRRLLEEIRYWHFTISANFQNQKIKWQGNSQIVKYQVIKKYNTKIRFDHF